MKFTHATHGALILGLLMGAGCGETDPNETPDATATPTAEAAEPTAEEKQAVVDNYAAIVYQSYKDAYDLTATLDSAIQSFVADPTQANMDAAKSAWLAAREVYGQTEVYRFYAGPIDDDDGPEGAINAWPMDEAYVDYVLTSCEDGEILQGGLINDPENFPEISQATIAGQNEVGGEENVSSGYHAIEFLLWGQDCSAESAGNRPVEDYVDGAEGHFNQDRRRTYLSEVSKLLLTDLNSVVVEWEAGVDGNYRHGFTTADIDDSIARMLVGIGTMAGGELSGERIYVAYETKDQEDEHSCFSDNTHVDIWANAKGIENVYLGNYGTIDGAGIDTLIAITDPALNERIIGELETAMTAVNNIPDPFDQAILGADDAPNRIAVYDAVSALVVVGDSTVDAATSLGYTISIALE